MEYPEYRKAATEAADLLEQLAASNSSMREKHERALIALEEMVSVAESQGWDNAEIHNARDILSNTSMSDPEPLTPTSKVANPKDSLDAPVVLGMGSKTILPEGH